MRSKLFEFIFKKHIIFMIGFVWLLIAELGHCIISVMDLQYDDGGLGTILILGQCIYAFPVWILSECSMPFKINKFLDPFLLAMFVFLALDLVVYKFQKKRMTTSSRGETENNNNNNNDE